LNDGGSLSDAETMRANGEEAGSHPSPLPRFVVEPDGAITNPTEECSTNIAAADADQGPRSAAFSDPHLPAATGSPDLWRQEVAARVHRYKSRRQPRAPRYPSLALKFEPPEPLPNAEPFTAPTVVEEIAPQPVSDLVALAEPASIPHLYPIAPPQPAKIIEFPRPWIPPVRPVDELAEPVMDRPRIIEVPDILPPPPAMGGILMEPQQEPPQEKRPGFEIPLQSAPMSQRLLAAGIDAAIIMAALVAFGYVAFRFAGAIPPLSQTASLGIAMAVVLWAAYQYASIVFSGSTIGLQVARLQLCCFDGTPAGRRARRWRALASLLSGFSLGLGYAWCFLDEDGLCWHDRITRTYMAPKQTK
jgi:uncharacterized RDD family membrane protein YckC